MRDSELSGECLWFSESYPTPGLVNTKKSYILLGRNNAHNNERINPMTLAELSPLNMNRGMRTIYSNVLHQGFGLTFLEGYQLR